MRPGLTPIALAARTQDPRQGDGQQDAGEGEKDVDQAHQEQIDPAAGKGPDPPHQHPDRGGESDDAEAHHKGDARPDQ
jgi:hypothetical protein